jgi:hypothetical protein
VKRIVTVGCKNERREAGLRDADAQFLVQLADQAGLRRLAGLDLAPRKLPQPRQLLPRRPPADQHPPVDIDERRRGDEDECLALGQDL